MLRIQRRRTLENREVAASMFVPTGDQAETVRRCQRQLLKDALHSCQGQHVVEVQCRNSTIRLASQDVRKPACSISSDRDFPRSPVQMTRPCPRAC